MKYEMNLKFMKKIIKNFIEGIRAHIDQKSVKC